MMTFGSGVGQEILGISRSIQPVRQLDLLQAPQQVHLYCVVIYKQRENQVICLDCVIFYKRNSVQE